MSAFVKTFSERERRSARLAGVFGALWLSALAAVAAVPEDAPDNVDVLTSASVYAAVEEDRSQEAVQDVTIGVPDTADIGLQRPMMISTVEKLSRAMPSTRFHLRVILTADGAAQLERIKPDFMFAAAGADGMLRREGIEAYRIATRKSDLAKEAGKSTGSVFVALKSRTDLRELKDLRNKTVVAGFPDSVPGWLAAMGEVSKAGFDADDFFGEKHFLFEYYPEILAALWGGKVDAAVLPTCLLEAVQQQGLVAVDELKVVHDKSDESLACRRSTDLYPDMSLIGFSWTPERLVRDVTVAVMTQHPDTEAQWLSFVSHANVDALFRELKAGPYGYLRDVSLSALYARHTAAFWAGAVALASLVLYGILLQVLVRRRTRELSETVAEQRRMEEQAREHRRRLGHLERRNIVNQMSGMIAHEINSPVGAICNFKAILDMLLEKEKQRDDNVRFALDGIESEAQRIAGIVGRVRSYAKQQKHAHKPCDLVDIARRAVRALHLSTPVKAEVFESYGVESASVLGDRLELELLVLNLLRNASEVTPQRGSRVRIRLTVGLLEDGRVRLQVQDNGRALSDEAFGRLTTMMQSVKPEGLGMGLSIVRGIADSHGAELTFERAEPSGLRVMLTLECEKNEAEDNQAHDREAAPQ